MKIRFVDIFDNMIAPGILLGAGLLYCYLIFFL